jgi:hypothetical protein
VKKRRTDREDEKAAQEEEKELMLREVALAEAVQLERKEEEFHLKQAMERSTIRLKEGRAKPIDILYQNLNASLAEFDMSMTDPTVVFAGLSLKELQVRAGYAIGVRASPPRAGRSQRVSASAWWDVCPLTARARCHRHCATISHRTPVWRTTTRTASSGGRCWCWRTRSLRTPRRASTASGHVRVVRRSSSPPVDCTSPWTTTSRA